MKKAFSLEILILFLAGVTGAIWSSLDKWYLGMITTIIGFTICSYLIGFLKRETLNEYINKKKEAEK